MKRMHKHLILLFVFIGGVGLLSSCKTSTPQLDYVALARASNQLGLDIAFKDNPYLYVESAQWIGTPYRGGGKSKRGVDCSALTQNIYHTVYHKKLKRTTNGQKKQAKRISKRNLQEGDLVFFSSNRSRRKVAHVGIYLKDNLFIHASTSKGVIISSLNSTYYKKHWLHGGRI